MMDVVDTQMGVFVKTNTIMSEMGGYFYAALILDLVHARHPDLSIEHMKRICDYLKTKSFIMAATNALNAKKNVTLPEQEPQTQHTQELTEDQAVENFHIYINIHINTYGLISLRTWICERLSGTVDRLAKLPINPVRNVYIPYTTSKKRKIDDIGSNVEYEEVQDSDDEWLSDLIKKRKYGDRDYAQLAKGRVGIKLPRVLEKYGDVDYRNWNMEGKSHEALWSVDCYVNGKFISKASAKKKIYAKIGAEIRAIKSLVKRNIPFKKPATSIHAFYEANSQFAAPKNSNFSFLLSNDFNNSATPSNNFNNSFVSSTDVNHLHTPSNELTKFHNPSNDLKNSFNPSNDLNNSFNPSNDLNNSFNPSNDLNNSLNPSNDLNNSLTPSNDVKNCLTLSNGLNPSTISSNDLQSSSSKTDNCKNSTQKLNGTISIEITPNMARFKDYVYKQNEIATVSYNEQIREGTLSWAVQCLLRGKLTGIGNDDNSLYKAMEEAASQSLAVIDERSKQQI